MPKTPNAILSVNSTLTDSRRLVGSASDRLEAEAFATLATLLRLICLFRTPFRNATKFSNAENTQVVRALLGLVEVGSPLVNIKLNGGFDSHTPPPHFAWIFDGL
jgi:hypothetical protein